MHFRPCIDLHQGQVKQIIGATLRDGSEDSPETNFVSRESAAYYASLYKEDELSGGHIIMLGPGNDAAAIAALSSYPGGLQIGGGITPANAGFWLAKGAAKIIVTSYLFSERRLCHARLQKMRQAVGKERLVLDLSCRHTTDGYTVVTDRWQTFTDLKITAASLNFLSEYCSEFLVHGVDMEGRQQGIEENLVRLLSSDSPVPATYAGGIRNREDLNRFAQLSGGKMDFTVGSALDIFGGKGLTYAELVVLDKAQRNCSPSPGTTLN